MRDDPDLAAIVGAYNEAPGGELPDWVAGEQRCPARVRAAKAAR